MFSCTLCRKIVTFNQLFVLYRHQQPTDNFCGLITRLESQGKRLALAEEAGLCCGRGCQKCQGHFKVVSWNKNKKTFGTEGSLQRWSIVVVTESAQEVPKIVHAAQRLGVYRLFLHLVDWLGFESTFERPRRTEPSPHDKLQEYCEKWMVQQRRMHVCEGDCSKNCTLFEL